MSGFLCGFLLAVAGFFVVAWRAGRAGRGVDSDYLLAGRGFGTWVVGLSVAGANNSGFMFLGAVGAGYTQGLASLWWPLAFFFGELTYWYFFPGKLNALARERAALTVPQMLGSSWGPREGGDRVRSFAGVLVLMLMGVYLVSQFYAGGKVINGVLPAIAPSWGAILTAALILAYVVKGGIRASVWTDVYQAVLMIAVAWGMLAYVVILHGGPADAWAGLRAAEPRLFEMTQGRGFFALLLYCAGFYCAGIGFGLGQPHGMVRVLAGKDPATADRARWIYLVYSYGLWLGMTAFGMLMTQHYRPDIDPEQALVHFADDALHPLLAGIAIAGIFSAIASTASAQLLVCSSALAVDVSPRLRELGLRWGVRYQYAATLAVGAAGAILAALNERLTVYALVLYGTAALGCAIAPAVLITAQRWRATPRGLVAAMAAGAAVSVAWNLLGWTAVVNEALPGIAAALVAWWMHDRAAGRADAATTEAP